MGYAKHIGRVGTLAVALGVGAAAATAPAIANAQPDSGSSSSASSSTGEGASTNLSSSTASSPTGAATPSPDTAPPSGPAPSDVPGGSYSSRSVAISATDDIDASSSAPAGGRIPETDDDDVDALVETAEDQELDAAPSTGDNDGPATADNDDMSEIPAVSATSVNEPASTGPAGGAELPVHHPGRAYGGPPSLASADDVARTVTTQPEPRGVGRIATEVTTSPDASPSVVVSTPAVTVRPNISRQAAPAHPVPALPTPVVSLVNTVASILLAPFLTTSPLAPAQRTMLWAVLAFVRREIERTFSNHRPDAVSDFVIASEDAAQTIVVLANDVDAENALKITHYTQPAHGDLVLNPDGTFTYTPDPDYNGPDTFKYIVSDDSSRWHLHGLLNLLTGWGHSDTATVHIAVGGVDDAPVAVRDTRTVDEDSRAVTIDVLANDTDTDGGPKKVIGVVRPATTTGSVEFDDTTVTYTPAANFHGEESFTYILNGGSTATVTVTVNPVDDPPTAVGDFRAIDEDSPAVTIDVVGNDTDIDGGPKKVIGVERPATFTGSVEFDDTTVTYTPAANFHGQEAFTYILDGGSTAAVTVTVNPVNDAPTAVGDGFTSAGTAAYGTVTGTVDAEDVDNDALTYELTTRPTNGRVTVDSLTGQFTYTPTLAGRLRAAVNAADGTDSFVVTVDDPNGGTIDVPVTVTISPTAITRTDATTVSHREGTAIDGLAISPAGDRVYVLHENMVAIDTTADPNTFRATIPRSGVGIVVMNIPGGGSRAYFTDGGVWMFDNTNGAFIDANPATPGTADPIAVAGGPKALAASPDGTRLYVTQVNAASVSVIDTAQNRVIATITDGIGTRPWAVAVGNTPGGTRAYVVNEGSNTVSVIDTVTNTKVVDPITVGGTPRAVAISPDGTRVYVANDNGGGVSVIDTSTNTVIASISVPGSRAGDLAVSPDGSALFVMSGLHGGFSVFDTASYDRITTVGTAFSLVNYLELNSDASRIYVSTFLTGEFDVIPVLLEFTIGPAAGPTV